MDEVHFTDTTIRDGQQSLWAIGMRTDMILPIAATLDQAGFAAIEVFANSFAKKMVRELRESFWDRIDLLRRRIRNTPVRVIRNRYLAAFQITPDVLEELWYHRMAAHGIDQVRVSDPTNTPTGWKKHVGFARKAGINPIVNLIFSISPKHTDEYYARKAAELAKLDVFRICIKDPASLLTPERTRTLVPAILKNVNGITVELHTHCHTGLGALCCLEAIKLGIRYVDAAIPPLADASSNPSLFDVDREARALGYSAKIDVEQLKPVARHFAKIAKEEGLAVGAPAAYDRHQYIHQVPGGMISNLKHQLSTVGLADRLDEVLEETGRVRAELGYPIMVTPYSQFVGVQATMNVISGERYKQIPDEVIQFALGLWGDEESSSMDANVKDRILGSARAKELAQWQPHQVSLQELRKKYASPDACDDDLLLCFWAGADQVAAMRAAGPLKRPVAKQQNLLNLIDELSKRKTVTYFHVNNAGASLTLRSGRNTA
jgi:oxaloacetate decarboxylase (Na+ extruding) subunit alpha